MTKASNTKEKTMESATKEKIALAINEARLQSKDYNSLNEESLKNAIDSQLNIESTILEWENEAYIIIAADGIYRIFSNGDIEKINTSEKNLQIGDYVMYEVEYEDVCSGYNFSFFDGWRVLDNGIKNPDGTFSNIKLISTGIPAMLYYNYMHNAGVEINGWWGTNEQVKAKYGEEYSQNFNLYPNRYAVVGLLENFESIPLMKGEGTIGNKGWYKKINSSNDEINGLVFKNDKCIETHNITLKELNKARNMEENNTETTENNEGDIGLFCLRNLANENSNFNYNSSSRCSYWIADCVDETTNEIRRITNTGSMDSKYSSERGIRPVICLKNNIKLKSITEEKWIIVE